jgi:hypothetical protein
MGRDARQSSANHRLWEFKILGCCSLPEEEVLGFRADFAKGNNSISLWYPNFNRQPQCGRGSLELGGWSNFGKDKSKSNPLIHVDYL